MSTGTELGEWQGAPVEHWRERWRLPALQVFREVGSTNDVIRAAALGGAPAGTTALAEYQSGGRGRFGRNWQAPPGSALLLSVLVRPARHGSPVAAGALPLRVGLAVARAIREHAGATPALKWPNDLLLGAAKVAGILCEAASDFVVVGVGVNLRQQVGDFSGELAAVATSLRLATGNEPDAAALAGTVLDALRPLFTAPHRPLEAPELETFATLDALRGHPVEVDGEAAGIAAGIDAHGALLVERDGHRRAVHAGTVRRTA